MSTETTNPIPENQIELPFQSYKVRVLKCEKKVAKSGHPMFVQEVEIFGAKPFTQNGVSIDPNGIVMTGWVSLQTKMIDAINVNRNSLGLPAIKSSQIGDLRAEDYVGQEGAVVAVSKKEEVKNEVTGETVVNPFTGKPVLQFNKKITQWLARE